MFPHQVLGTASNPSLPLVFEINFFEGGLFEIAAMDQEPNKPDDSRNTPDN